MKRLAVDDRKKHDRLTPEQSDLAGANVGLATWLVGRRQSAVRRLGYETTIEAAWLGLCDAAHRFDATQGFKFSTYACRCMNMQINAEIRNAHRQCRNVVRPDGQPATTRSLLDADAIGKPAYRDGPSGVDGRDFLESLLPIQRCVLELRLEGLTLQEIGDKFNRSYECVRMIEKRALSHLEV